MGLEIQHGHGILAQAGQIFFDARMGGVLGHAVSDAELGVQFLEHDADDGC